MPSPSTINTVVNTIQNTGKRSVKKVSQGLDINGGMMVCLYTQSDLHGERVEILTSQSILTTTTHLITQVFLASLACINYMRGCQEAHTVDIKTVLRYTKYHYEGLERS